MQTGLAALIDLVGKFLLALANAVAAFVVVMDVVRRERGVAYPS